jgi:hypothetical protein
MSISCGNAEYGGGGGLLGGGSGGGGLIGVKDGIVEVVREILGNTKG